MSNANNFLLYIFIFVAIALGFYWYFYTAFIERLRLMHSTVYVSLDMPEQMDSNLSQRNRKLWGFILHLKFRSLSDVRLSLFGYGIIVMSLLTITIILVSIAIQPA